jgi:hypothetical protein
MGQEVRRWFFNGEDRVQCRITLYEVRKERSGIAEDIYQFSSVFLSDYHLNTAL